LEANIVILNNPHFLGIRWMILQGLSLAMGFLFHVDSKHGTPQCFLSELSHCVIMSIDNGKIDFPNFLFNHQKHMETLCMCLVMATLGKSFSKHENNTFLEHLPGGIPAIFQVPGIHPVTQDDHPQVTKD